MNEVAVAQDWLIQLVSSRNSDRSLTDRESKSTFMAEGRRNVDLTSLAGFLTRKFRLSESELGKKLDAINQTGEKPIGAQEVHAIARSIASRSDGVTTQLDEAHLSHDLAACIAPVFCSSPGMGWLWYNGSHWEPDHGGKKLQEAAKDFVLLLDERMRADPNVSVERIKAAKAFLTASKIKNLATLASSDPAVMVSASAFDRSIHLFNLSNGTLDYSSGNVLFKPHNSRDYLTKSADAAYDRNATCPNFDRLLSTVLRKEDREFVLRFFGYAMTGCADQQTFAIFHGKGANGKSTLVNVILRILGGYGVTVEPSTFMQQKAQSIRTDIARLRGVRLAVSSELGIGEILDAPLIKRLVGGDTVTARSLYQEAIEFRPICIPIFVTNALPIINGGDEALRRRITILEFDRVVPVEDRDLDLPRKLWEERSGILNRLIEGLNDYLSDRSLRRTERMENSAKNYAERTDLLGQFILDECETGEEFTCAADTFFSAYRTWCLMQSVRPLSQPLFKNELSGRTGISAKKTSKCNMWVGIHLSSNAN